MPAERRLTTRVLWHPLTTTKQPNLRSSWLRECYGTPRTTSKARGSLQRSKRVPSSLNGRDQFTTCFATPIELTLKAYLAASGVPITTLANHIRHDLELAFGCAQKHGFTPPDAGFWEVVQWLAPYHRDHSFRYGKAHGYLTHPEPSPVADIITNTIKAVEPYVHRQYEKINQGR